MPKYTVSRFDNDDDAKEAESLLKACNVLRPRPETPLSEYELAKLSYGQGFIGSYLKILAYTRSKHDVYRNSKLEVPFCSPWPSKSAPASSISNDECPLGGKIYCSVQMFYGEESDNYVLTRETREIFCYQPFWMHATGLVAFPRVKRNEVWTIGWVQAIKNESFIDMHYKNKSNVTSMLVLKFLFILKFCCRDDKIFQ